MQIADCRLRNGSNRRKEVLIVLSAPRLKQSQNLLPAVATEFGGFE
jgi:hypothetical protein